jgi:xylose isomerase
LLVAEQMIHDELLKSAVDARYAGWNSPAGQDILGGRTTLDQLAERVLERNEDVAPVSGRQEYLENLVNRFCGA